MQRNVIRYSDDFLGFRVTFRVGLELGLGFRVGLGSRVRVGLGSGLGLWLGWGLKQFCGFFWYRAALYQVTPF